uniref:Uncharacterized protein n=1 Tax=Anguilla anguilla TaxID=7936 RepID=A0A0E9WIB2_ANGAN
MCMRCWNWDSVTRCLLRLNAVLLHDLPTKTPACTPELLCADRITPRCNVAHRFQDST